MGEVYSVFIPIFMGQSLILTSYEKLLKTSSLISMDTEYVHTAYLVT